MSTKKIFTSAYLIILAIILNSCGPNSKFNQKYNKPFKHNTPLIKNDIREQGQAEISKTLEILETADINRTWVKYRHVPGAARTGEEEQYEQGPPACWHSFAP